MLKKVEHCNVEAMLRVKQHIMDHPHNFNMGSFHMVDVNCGTICCIGGWAIELADEAEREAAFEKGIERARTQHDLMEDEVAAQLLLGIDEHTAWDLFYCEDSTSGRRVSVTDVLHNVTVAQAVQAIDNVIAYGEPRWKEILNA